MFVEIETWGNSLAIRIPEDFALKRGLKVGSQVRLVVDNTSSGIKLRKRPRYTLEELLASVPDDYELEEWDTGPPVGREVW